MMSLGVDVENGCQRIGLQVLRGPAEQEMFQRTAAGCGVHGHPQRDGRGWSQGIMARYGAESGIVCYGLSALRNDPHGTKAQPVADMK